MSELDRLVIERHDSMSTAGLCDDILLVNAASHDDQMYDPGFHPDQFWERLADLYLPGRDFELVAARNASVIVGYAFGSPRDQHGAIWDDLRSTYPDWDLPADTVPMYMFREFAVHPDHQRQGIGRQLHDALVDPRPEPWPSCSCAKTTSPHKPRTGRGVGANSARSSRSRTRRCSIDWS